MSFIAKYFIARDIQRYFGFLFERGYTLNEIFYDSKNFGNWWVVLQSSCCVIFVTQDRSEILLSFASHKSETNNQIALESMIYFLSGGKTFIGFFDGDLFREKKRQFERLAQLLKGNIDRIEPYFGSDYEKFKIELLVAQRKYNERLMKSSR
jgi:hypothetical protein